MPVIFATLNIQNPAMIQLCFMYGVIGRLQRLISLIDENFYGPKSKKIYLVGSANSSLETVKVAVRIYKKCLRTSEISNDLYIVIVTIG